MSEVSNKRFVHFSGTKEEFKSTDYPSTYNDSIVFINEDGGHDVNKTIYTHGKYYGQGVIVRDNDSEMNSAVITDSSSSAGNFSTAFGYNCVASGDTSHAEGYYTTASGNCSHTEGYGCVASGKYSHAEGYYTTASNNYSFVAGKGTQDSNENDFVIGQYNSIVSNSIFNVGCGTSSSARNTAMFITKNGNTTIEKATINNVFPSIIHDIYIGIDTNANYGTHQANNITYLAYVDLQGVYYDSTSFEDFPTNIKSDLDTKLSNITVTLGYTISLFASTSSSTPIKVYQDLIMNVPLSTNYRVPIGDFVLNGRYTISIRLYVLDVYPIDSFTLKYIGKDEQTGSILVQNFNTVYKYNLISNTINIYYP